jgi:hypothetical protein
MQRNDCFFTENRLELLYHGVDSSTGISSKSAVLSYGSINYHAVGLEGKISESNRPGYGVTGPCSVPALTEGGEGSVSDVFLEWADVQIS